MALKLYDPRTKTFVAYTTPDTALPFDQVLLLNILIQLKTINHFMSVQNGGSAYEDPANIMTDIVSVT